MGGINFLVFPLTSMVYSILPLKFVFGYCTKYIFYERLSRCKKVSAPFYEVSLGNQNIFLRSTGFGLLKNLVINYTYKVVAKNLQIETYLPSLFLFYNNIRIYLLIFRSKLCASWNQSRFFEKN